MNKRIFDRPIAFQRIFVELTGSVASALLLSQACYWSQRGKEGWFYKTQKEWEEETGMSRRELDTAKKKAKKYLRTELRGVPARTHYFLDWDLLHSDCTKEPIQFGGIRQSSLHKNAKLSNTETTTETTTDTSNVIYSKEDVFMKTYIIKIIKAFEDINPDCKNFYGNKTERGACEFLVKEYGFEEVINLIRNIIPKTNTMSYMQNIQSPSDLKRKYSALKASLLKLKNKQDNETKKRGVVLFS